MIRRMLVWIQDSCPWLTETFESQPRVSSGIAQTQHSCAKRRNILEFHFKFFSVVKNSKARGCLRRLFRSKTSQTFLEEIFPVNLGQREVRFFSRTSVISIHHRAQRQNQSQFNCFVFISTRKVTARHIMWATTTFLMQIRLLTKIEAEKQPCVISSRSNASGERTHQVHANRRRLSRNPTPYEPPQ